MVAMNKAGQSFFQWLTSKADSLNAVLSAATIISQALAAGKESISSVRELNTALMDLKKTTTMSSKELKHFYFASNDIAKQMGVTTSEIINQASAWSRLGFSSAESAVQMAKLSSQFASISPGLDVDEATASLVTMMRAYDVEANDVLDGIMSKINDAGKKFGTSNTEIAEGLRKSSAAMAATGSSLESNIGLFIGGQEIIQDASQVGNALRSIALRIRSYDEETEQLSDDLAHINGEVTELTRAASNDGKGISLFTNSSQTEYKDLVQYLGEVYDIWYELGTKAQNSLLEKLFGNGHIQAGAAIIENFDQVRASIEVMENSAGSADREMSVIMDSIDYKVNRLKETGTGIAQNLFQQEDIKNVVDGLTKVGEAADWTTEKLGLFGTISTALSGILGAKGYGLT